jgi:gliding motility-associated-like protein
VPQVTATISNSVAICDGQSAKLTAGGSNQFAWTPTLGLNISDESIVYANPKSTTVYTANVSTGGFCGTTATVLVQVNPTPTIDVGPDLTFNLDEPMYINAVGSGTLTWISGEKILCASCPSTQILPTTSGCYKAQAINQFGCTAVDELCVDITTDYNIYIPNVFTPNADGKNDAFIVYGTGITKIEILIFDRWGEKLFSTTDAQKGWDGTVKGVLSKEDAYTYVVNFSALDGKTHTKTGHVTLLK